MRKRHLHIILGLALGVANLGFVLQEPPVRALEGRAIEAAVDRAPLTTTLLATPASSPTLKVAVTEDGIYELTPSDLEGAGIDLTGLDPRTIRLSNRGTELPIYVPGEEDGHLDPADRIVFYGTAMTGTYTVENVYWLAHGGGDGLRMPERDGAPDSAPLATAFYNTIHAEQNPIYWLSMPNGEGRDHYFWEQLGAPSSATYTVTLNHIATVPENGEVKVTLHGKTGTTTTPDHHTRVYLNGAFISDAWWDGQIVYQHQSTVPQGKFVKGDNSVTVESVGDTGASTDIVYHNRFEIGYWDTYVAEGDALAFTGPASNTYTFEVTGFTTDTVAIYDVTRPFSVTRIVSHTVELTGSTYLARFEDACTADARYLALTDAQRKPPAAIVPDEPSALRSPSNTADYVIITHGDFVTSALALAAYRDGQGMRTEVVTVDDVYDEFNDGIFGPEAIRDFVSYAHTYWTADGTAAPPQYVLLLGDANMDYKDNLGTGNVNYVPTYLIETPDLGQTPSDNWFVSVSGDDVLPDLFIGRIPARTEIDAGAVVDKIIAYEQSPPPGEWTESALFVADDDEPAFESTSEDLIALLPGEFTPQRVYVGQYTPPDDPTGDIIDTIDGGALMVNYIGHGNVDNWAVWAGGNTFQTSDIASLDNGGKLPFVTVANCLNGFFAHPATPYAYSLAEEFVRVDGKGALAAWAPTGLGYPSGHRALIGELYRVIFEQGDHVLGSATTAAKLATYDQHPEWGYLVETYVLLGDPATRLNLPLPAYPVVHGVTPSGGRVGASVATVISGTTFVDGATVELIQGSDIITGTAVTVIGADEIHSTFDLTGAKAGAWDVRVTNPNGLSGTLPDGFTVWWTTTYLPLILRE